jgi:hypothetical protein
MCGYVDYFYAAPEESRFDGPFAVATYYLRYVGPHQAFRDVLTIATGDREARGRMRGGAGYVMTCPFCGAALLALLGDAGQLHEYRGGWRIFGCPLSHRVHIDMTSGAPAGWR